MAIVQYTLLMPEYYGILDVFSNRAESLEMHSSTAASYTDPNTGYHIVFEGTGFKYKGETIKAGHLDTVRFTDTEGHDFFTVTDVDAKLKDLTTALTEKNLVAVLKKLFGGADTWTGSDNSDYLFGDKGNDKLVGGLGDDELAGGGGKDILTGNEGSDYFAIWKGVGKDKVTDFHADGGEGVQDYVQLWTEDYKIRGNDERTIVDLGKGHKLVLLGVDRADFSVDDIWFV